MYEHFLVLNNLSQPIYFHQHLGFVGISTLFFLPVSSLKNLLFENYLIDGHQLFENG